jgi:site-specific recombinase XerC
MRRSIVIPCDHGRYHENAFAHRSRIDAGPRACDAADRLAHQSQRDVASDDRIIPRWSPNRLRHSAATEIRKRFGLEAVQVVLGHAKADVSQIYAERDLGLAERIMREVG